MRQYDWRYRCPWCQKRYAKPKMRDRHMRDLCPQSPYRKQKKED